MSKRTLTRDGSEGSIPFRLGKESAVKRDVRNRGFLRSEGSASDVDLGNNGYISNLHNFERGRSENSFSFQPSEKLYK